MQRAKVFEYILDNMKISIQDDELIVGSQTTSVRGVPVFPEYGAKWIINEIDLFNTRSTDPIIVTKEDKAELLPVLESWGDDTFDVKTTKAMDPYTIKAQECGVSFQSVRAPAAWGIFRPFISIFCRSDSKALLRKPRIN